MAELLEAFYSILMLQDLLNRFALIFDPASTGPLCDPLAMNDIVLISSDKKSTLRLQTLHSKLLSFDVQTKHMAKEKAQFLIPIAKSLPAILECHGLIAVYGPLPPDAETYDVNSIFRQKNDLPPPESEPGCGNGLIFDVRNSRVTVQFRSRMHTLVESEILEHFSLFKTGIPNPPKAVRDEILGDTA